MTPELRLIRYFVAVAEAGTVTRAAENLHISQPSLSAAVKQLEGQLGVKLLARRGRRIAITEAGELLLRRGRELLAHADAVATEVRGQTASATGRLRLGLTPTARYGLAPELLAACTTDAPGVMLYSREDTTGALLRDVADGALDLAVTFCAPADPPGVELELLRYEPAVVHLPTGHALADRSSLSLSDLSDETVLIAASADSHGFTTRIRSAFDQAGVTPRTRADPYPDLGLQAVRERLGVVVYARSAYPAELPGSAFVPLGPRLELPFHLATRTASQSGPVRTVRDIARRLATVGPEPYRERSCF